MRNRAPRRSDGAQFEETFWGVMGLYLRPSDKALVLCRDEKSRCQALARIPPGLPLGIGPIRTPGHDYVRHGTITLFAALNYLKGRIIGRTEAKHAHVEWRRVLKRIGREVSKDLAVHLFVDNDCTHKHAEVNAWLAKHRRFHGHFTPVGSAWLNLVERFFADLAQDVVRNGSFGSVRQLLSRIELYLAERKENPKPYQWKANRNEVLAGIHRARLAAGQ